ncbi:hypothetical protein GCK32_011353, partial [Trichostrongylus colubriformis]
EFFTAITQFFCISAFNALAGCIDENNARVNQDCDQQCHPNSLATGIVVKNTVMNQLEHPLVSKNVNMRRIIEPHMSRFFFSQGCKIAQCLMTCTRTKYNMLCEGTAGSLLLEMLTLPLSTRDSASFPSSIHLTSFLGGLLPYQCSFLTAPEGERGSFRIDPELDKEIKRMIAQCLMTCTRTKYNMLCEGTAGSLLLEMLTLPLSTRDSASFPSSIHLTSFLGGLLPYQCSFLTAPEGERGSFRIDPELDKEIKRMYSNKNVARTSSRALPSSLSQPVEVENPFLKIPNVFHQESPFDNPEVNEKLLRSVPLPPDANDVEESSGNADISLSQNVNG